MGNRNSMFQPKTVFILGAAFSYELGLPLGSRLKDEVANLLSPGASERVHMALTNGGHSQVVQPVRELIAALPIHRSIDGLIEFHRENERLVNAARIGIAAAILREEERSEISQRTTRHSNRPLPLDNSYGDLFTLLIQGCSQADLEEAFSRVAFINFNYDRSLEVFLFRALTEHAGFTAAVAESLVSGVTIKRPYGWLGPLFGEQALPYALPLDHAPLESIAPCIKTFTEGVDSESGQAIKQMTATASRLIFLGCAHHSQNMQLLAPEQQMIAKAIYGTLYAPPPTDELLKPPMETFLGPAIQAFKQSIDRWQYDASGGKRRYDMNRIRIEVSTSRQLIARYGSEWTDA